jgi:hypothetical protein
VEALLRNYGIKVDSEDNLGIRYLRRVGDGRVNKYYY